MAQELNFYSRLYDNFFDDEMCDAYVATFEETMKKDAKEVEKTSICTGPIRPDGHQICGNCNCQRMNPMGFDRFDHLNKLAMNKFQNITERYKKDVSLHASQWPKNLMWEEFRMKRFLVGDGSKQAEQFCYHEDVISHEGAKRILIIMVY